MCHPEQVGVWGGEGSLCADLTRTSRSFAPHAPSLLLMTRMKNQALGSRANETQVQWGGRRPRRPWSMKAIGFSTHLTVPTEATSLTTHHPHHPIVHYPSIATSPHNHPLVS